MPGGNSEAGRTDSEIDVILPVVVEIVIVAGVSLLLITAREDARTVISCDVPLGSEVPVAWGAISAVQCG